MDERDPIARFRLQRCYHCGYDLRGLASGTCPECGTRVADAIVLPGSGQGLLLAMFCTAAAGFMIVGGVAGGRISAIDLVVYAAFCSLVAFAWLRIPRQGVARDGSALIIIDDGIIRPVSRRYEHTPWSRVDEFSLDRSRHAPDMRGGTAFYRCELLIMTEEPPALPRSSMAVWFERVRSTTLRSRITASEHERELLEQEIRRMSDRGAPSNVG